MNALKWINLWSAVVFSPDESGGAAPAGGGGGDAGGGSVAPDSGGASSPDGGGADSGRSAPETSPAEGGSARPDWSKLGSADDLDYVEIPPATAPEPPVQPQAVPAEAPQAPSPAEALAQPTPATQEVSGEASGPRLSAADPMGIAAGLEANRDAVLAHLAQTKFALTEQDIQELETDVVTAVPKIMSRIFFESQVSMQKFLAQAVPGMVKQYNTATRANEDAEKMFFDAHKVLDIKNPSHRAAAVRIATIYRQANPQIPLQQLIAEVGPMVAAALKLNGSARPAVAAQPRGGTPFRPAVGGSGAPPIAEAVNEWAGLGRNFDDT